MQKFTVDRTEDGGVAVLEGEDGSFTDVKLELLPEGTREGTVLILDGGVWTRDENSEQDRRARLLQKQRELLARKKK